MKKRPLTPDVNAKAPRPRRVSSDDPEVPTMDMPPDAAADTTTGFDRATAATDQEYRSGLLPGSDDTTPRERTINQDDEDRLELYDMLEPGADLEPDVESEPDAELEPGVESGPDVEPDSAEADTEPAPDAEADPDAGPDPDNDVEPGIDEIIDSPDYLDSTLAAEFWPESQTFPQQDDPDQEGIFDEESEAPNKDQPGNPNHEQIIDPENDTLGAVKPPDKT